MHGAMGRSNEAQLRGHGQMTRTGRGVEEGARKQENIERVAAGWRRIPFGVLDVIAAEIVFHVFLLSRSKDAKKIHRKQQRRDQAPCKECIADTLVSRRTSAEGNNTTCESEKYYNAYRPN